MLSDKNVLQIIWIFSLTFFMAIVRVFYKEFKTFYVALRSGILSMWVWVLAWIVCYHLDFPFLLILFITSLFSLLWEIAIDIIVKEFPAIFRDILKSYFEKWKW